VIFLGYWISEYTSLSWLFLPPLHILAITLPALFLVYLAGRQLPYGSPQRAWGVFNSGLVLGPSLIIFIEMIALVSLATLVLIYLAGQPDILNQLLSLSKALQVNPSAIDQLFETLSPYLIRPGIIAAILTFTSLIVPLIEEALKPVGVWLLARRRLTPAAGFVAGALSGAGFALFESLFVAGLGESWAILALTRAVTVLVHVTTTAFVGWALVGAFRGRRFLQLGLTYLAAVAIHGLWNGLAVIEFLNVFNQSLSGSTGMPILSALGIIALPALAGIALCLLSALLIGNQRLRNAGSLLGVSQTGKPIP
jgi:RsiW-degrading membrane proteinase PrsW (M82 family)